MFYSPFTDENGNIKKLKDINYSDLKILENIDEGYKIEYKLLWDDNFKKKSLCKSISSFANTDGGWLFIGVDNNGSLHPIDKTRTDFGQQIGEIVKTHISPSPRFESKIVISPEDKQKGVLIILIPEGIEPPYLCNGTIYTRVGSSSEPIKIQHRADIDNLYTKKKEINDIWDKFCTNKIYENANYPMCSIYLYGQNNTPFISYENEENIISNFARECGFENWMSSSFYSYLFHNSKNISIDTCTTSLEFFRNWNIKLHIPFCILPETISGKIAEEIKAKEPKYDISGFKAIDGYLTSEIISFSLSKILSKFVEYGCILEDYRIKVEISNVKNSFLFYPSMNNEWINIASNRFRYCAKHTVATEIPIPLTSSKDNLFNTFAILALGIGNAYGYTYNEFINLYGCGGQARERMLSNSKFTNNDYFNSLESYIDSFI